jgi:indole-3-glycerol phosphate synthase
MATILDKIVETKRRELEERCNDRSLASVRAAAEAQGTPRNFYQAIVSEHPRGIHFIAEIKRSSPSAGLIREDFDPVVIAKVYHAGGASAISVLTDETYFDGQLAYIEQVKAAVPLPVLRKDFMIDEYQVYEARAAGADAILLIGEILTPQKILDMLILANELKMTTLIEVHNADTLMLLRSVVGFPLERYSLLGINNRNLSTQTTDIATTGRLAGMLEDTTGLVAESGVKTREDVDRLKAAGAAAILIGETLMRADDIAAKIDELFG